MRAHLGYDQVKAVNAMRITDMTAGGTGDNTEVVGTTIDRKDALSVVLLVEAKAVLADTETLSIVNIDMQQSDDGSTWDADEPQLVTDAVLHTASGAETVDKVYHLEVDVAKGRTLKRYIRFNITPDLSASSIDTARVGATALLLGQRVKPVSKDELTNEDLV